MWETSMTFFASLVADRACWVCIVNITKPARHHTAKKLISQSFSCSNLFIFVHKKTLSCFKCKYFLPQKCFLLISYDSDKWINWLYCIQINNWEKNVSYFLRNFIQFCRWEASCNITNEPLRNGKPLGAGGRTRSLRNYNILIITRILLLEFDHAEHTNYTT